MMRPILIHLWLLALLHVHLPEQWHLLIHGHEHPVRNWNGLTTIDEPHRHCAIGWDFMMPAEAGELHVNSILPLFIRQPYFEKQAKSEHRHSVFCRPRGPPNLI